MKKKALASLQQQAIELDQINDSFMEKMLAVFEQSFSAIATADPVYALNIIDQMNEKKAELKAVAKEREINAEMYIRTIASGLPDSIELEDDGDEEMN